MSKYNTDYFKVVDRHYDFESTVVKSEILNNTSDYLVDANTGDVWFYETHRPAIIPGLYDIDDWFYGAPTGEITNKDTYYVVSEEGNIGYTTNAEESINWFLTLDYDDNFDELYYADEDEVNNKIERGI